MTFDGFTIPDGAFLPPELIYLLPNISGAKLKVVIVVIYHNLQVGHDEPMSLADIEHYTGLAHSTAVAASSELVDDRILEREAIGPSFIYRLVVRFSNTSDRKSNTSVRKSNTLESRESERELNINLINNNDSLSDSLNLTGSTSSKIEQVRKLRQAGVYLKTAQNLVEEHDQKTIEEHLAYYQFALQKNFAQGPGWLVLSLKEGWGPPLGFQPPGGQTDADRRRYADWASPT